MINGSVSSKLKEIVRLANDEGVSYNYRKIEPELLLMSLLWDNQNKCIDVLKSLDIDIDLLFDEVNDYVISKSLSKPNVFKASKRDIAPCPLTKAVLDYCLIVSKELDYKVVNENHLMLALLTKGGHIKKMLEKHKLNYVDYLTAIFENKNENMEYEELDPTGGGNGNKKTPPKSNVKTKTPTLDNFSMNISEMARNNKIDPVIGRDKEIKRVSQILSRRKKNNPVLIGEAGVGKSTIAEGLAILINEGKCSASLMNKEIISLNIASVVGGTKYRGQFEERMKRIIDELIKTDNVLLFIDEIHTIVGAGNSSGSQDMSNIFKPVLAKGDVQVIGATTLNEFRENIEKDGALTRRFQQVLVNEPTFEETKNILMNIKGKYESFHNVTYSEETIHECVRLSDRYMTDKFMPDKAIDVMDECGSTVTTKITKPQYIVDLELDLKELISEKIDVVKKQLFEKAAELRGKEVALGDKIEVEMDKWRDKIKNDFVKITPKMVAEVTSLMVGIPVSKITVEENKKLLKMNETLKERVIGQDKAISKIVKSIQRNKLGIGDINKPIGSFMFLGNTGVGKTHLSKMIAEYLFGDTDSLIRIDMGEYVEKVNVSKLIGAAPGYVGYEEGGKLTEQVRRKPHSVILFDEIEKAHPDIFNTMLSILDEGYITDSAGRKINFKNTLIIMTSNVGVKQLSQFSSGIGFETPNNKVQDEKRVEDMLSKSVKKSFSPEFINRLDEIIIFKQLSEDEITKMVSIEIDQVTKRLEDVGYGLKVSKAAMEFIGQKGYDKEYGARPLKRAIQTLLENKITEEILNGNVKEGDKIKIGFRKTEEPHLTLKT